jgi:hypothetical protein
LGQLGTQGPPGVLTLRRGISPLIHVQLEKPRSLLGCTQRINEDRVVTSSIWSPDQGVIVLQKCREYCGIVQGQGLSSD